MPFIWSFHSLLYFQSFQQGFTLNTSIIPTLSLGQLSWQLCNSIQVKQRAPAETSSQNLHIGNTPAQSSQEWSKRRDGDTSDNLWDWDWYIELYNQASPQKTDKSNQGHGNNHGQTIVRSHRYGIIGGLSIFLLIVAFSANFHEITLGLD